MRLRLGVHVGIVELFVALIVLNAGLLALMSAFQSGSLGRAHHSHHASTPYAVVRHVAPTAGRSR